MASQEDTKKEDTLTCRIVCRELGTVAHDWKKIGIQLGVPHHKLKQFENDSDPLLSVVVYWLKGNAESSVPIEWKSIVAALKVSSVGEGGLAEQLSKKYCQPQDKERGPIQQKCESFTSHIEDTLDPVVKKDLKYVLEKNLQDIIAKYGSYVDCLRGIIEEKKVSPKALRTYLLTLSAFSDSHNNGQALTLMADKKLEFEKAETIPDIFKVLVTDCASFLNYEIFKRIIENYNIKVKQYKKLQYCELLKDYINKHKISEFVEINPLLKSKIGTKELIVKYDIESTCRLAKVKDLETFLVGMFGLRPSALEIVDIKKGCTIITFLMPASVAEFLFSSDTMFTSQQEDELRSAAVLWLKCNGQTFHFGRGKAMEQHVENPAVARLKEQLIKCSVCFDIYTDPKLLQCNHVYCHKCLSQLLERDQQNQLVLACPSCRQVTPVPSSGVASLPSDFRTSQLLDIIGEEKIAESDGASESIASSQSTIGNCFQHGETLELFCNSCEDIICWQCTKEDAKHHSHDYEELNKAFEEYKQELRSLLPPMERQSSEIRKALAQFHARHDEISDQRSKIEADINQSIQQLQDALEIRRKELISELDQHTQFKLKSLAAQKNILEASQASVNSCLHFMWENLKTDHQETMIKRSVTVAKAKEFSLAIPSDFMKPSIEADVSFSVLSDLSLQCRNYGHVSTAGSSAQLHSTAKSQDSALQSSDRLNLKTVSSEVVDIYNNKFFPIGIQLGIPIDMLKWLKEEEYPIPRTIDLWLSGNGDVPISWESLVNALQSSLVEEGEVAQTIRRKYCRSQDDVKEIDYEANAELDPHIKNDLEYILKRNLKDIGSKYASYVDNLCTKLQVKQISVDQLKTFLFTLPAFDDSEELAFTPDKKSAISKIFSSRMTSLFSYLTKTCASFLDYDIFERIRQNYGIEDETNYHSQLRQYLKMHSISEFTRINPKLGELSKDSSYELTIKLDIETTCSLAKVVELKRPIAEILGIDPSALRIIDIREGCVLLTFLIPVSVASILFTPHAVLTPQQVAMFQAISALWLKCNGFMFHFPHNQNWTENQDNQQLVSFTCRDTGRDEDNLPCNTAIYGEQKDPDSDIEFLLPQEIIVE